MSKTTDVLFILKRRENYSALAPDANSKNMSTGLFNSASFVSNMLNDAGISSVMEIAIDNNCIDSLVTKYQPKYCIIEALWVVPEKFAVLQPLHPTVEWIVRLHSEMPFMANEGIALNWIGEYVKYDNVKVGINAPRMYREVAVFLKAAHGFNDKQVRNKLVYLPNFYPQKYRNAQKIDYNKGIEFVCYVWCWGRKKTQLFSGVSKVVSSE